MSARVYCFASAKGGSGKTMITANIARLLASVGKQSLIIDCDAATHGMTLLYLVEVSSHTNQHRIGLFDQAPKPLLETRIEDAILSVSDGVDLLPATYTFTSGVEANGHVDHSPNQLERVVRILRPKYDFIFLDAQAGSDVHAREAMSSKVSDEVVIVSEYDPMSSAGVDRLRHLLGDDLGYARTWILLNKLLPEFVSKFEDFLSVMKYLPPVPWNSDVVRAYAKRKLALNEQEGNEFTLAIMRTIGALLGEDTERELAEWSKDRAYALKAPLEEQYVHAEAELMAALEAKRRFSFRRVITQMTAVYAFVALVAVALYLVIEVNTIESLDYGMGSNRLAIVVASVCAVLGSVAAIGYSVWKWTSGKRTADDLRYERVIAALEERLAKLEMLRSSSYEELVRRRGR